MVILCIHYTFDDAEADEVARLFREVQAESRMEPGVINFDIARSKEKPNVFVLWEEYVDEAAMTAHQTTKHFQELVLKKIRPIAKARVAETAYPIE